MSFDPVQVCQILTDEGVQFVLIGGFAGVIHGSTLPTEDIDVLPERSQPNLEKLARALTRLGAKIRTEAGPVATNLDAAFIANMPLVLNLETDYGDLDLVMTPAGELTSYEQWLTGARRAELREGLVVFVAGLDDIIASKVAANRPKDVRSLPYLESLREEIRRQGRG